MQQTVLASSDRWGELAKCASVAHLFLQVFKLLQGAVVLELQSVFSVGKLVVGHLKGVCLVAQCARHLEERRQKLPSLLSVSATPVLGQQRVACWDCQS